jgi:hypothetical protein
MTAVVPSRDPFDTCCESTVVTSNILPTKHVPKRARASKHRQGKPDPRLSALFDRDLESVRQTSDEAELVAVESPDPDDPVPIADVAVVQDEVVGRRVVADVSDVWIVAFWHALRGEGSGQSAIFSTWLKSRNVNVSGSWSARSCAVGLSASCALTGRLSTVMRIGVT